jgi:hypothetical protein
MSVFEKCRGVVKVQIEPIPKHYTMKAFWGCGGKASYIAWPLEVSGQLHSSATVFPGKNLQYPLDKRLAGPESQQFIHLKKQHITQNLVHDKRHISYYELQNLLKHFLMR